MKRLSFITTIFFSAQWLSAQTNVVHMRNFTGCDVICGIELFDDNHPSCASTLVLATPITINAGTQVNLTDAQLDAIGYSNVTPPYNIACCNVVPYIYVVAFSCRTAPSNCPPGNVTGQCTANPFGAAYQLTPSCGCATGPIYIEGSITPFNVSVLHIKY